MKRLVSVLVVLLLCLVVGGIVVYGVPFPFSSTPKEVVIQGTLLGSNEKTLTLQLQDYTEKDFTITPDTKVVSQVKSGETGPNLSDLESGAILRVIPVKPKSQTLAVVQVVSLLPTPPPSPLGPLVSIQGSLISKADGTLTLQASNGTVHILVDKSTSVYSHVAAGEKGKSVDDLMPGDEVTVAGVAGSDGLHAELIQL